MKPPTPHDVVMSLLIAPICVVIAIVTGYEVAWWFAGISGLGGLSGLVIRRYDPGFFDRSQEAFYWHPFYGRAQERIAAVDENPRVRLQRHIDEVNRAFTEAAALMSDLQRDLDAQQAAREVLLEQAGEQQRLLEVNEEQAEKIRQILVGETKATIRAERRRQWLFFALGALVSIPIGIAINLLVP